jgi:excisionase family DNA binding protein
MGVRRYTVSELAVLAGYHRRTVRDLINAGVIRGIRLGRYHAIEEPEVMRWLGESPRRIANALAQLASGDTRTLAKRRR